MENKIISAAEYKLPTLKQEQKTIVLIDVNGNNFEAVFNVPTIKQLMLMEEAAVEYKDVDGVLYEKKSNVRKIEWILNNLLELPVGLQIEHLNKLSALELADTFR